MQPFRRFVPAAAFWLLALAAQVSGYTNPILAISLAAVGVLLLAWPGFFFLRSWRNVHGQSATLTDEQKRRLFLEIHEFKGLVSEVLIIAYPSTNQPAQELAFQFRNFFDRAQITSTLSYIRPEPGQTGVMVAVQDVVDPPPAAMSLHKALVAAGIDAKIVEVPRDMYKSPFLLFIGPM